MAIAPWTCCHYRTVVDAAGDGRWSGIADDDGSPSLLDSRPSVIVANGRVTMARRARKSREWSSASNASFDGGEALAAVLRRGDRLECWRGATGEIGVAVTRAESLVLGLGALGYAPGAGLTIDHDPRIEERVLARNVRYIDRPGTHILWLDPKKPRELEARLREFDRGFTGVKLLAIVARSDDTAVQRELMQRTTEPPYGPPRDVTSFFLAAAERFATVEEWLEYSRALSTERPRDLWVRITSGARDCRVAEGTTATFEDWLVHVHRVHEPGLPGQFTQLGLVRANAGVSAAVLECSTAAVATGLTVG